MEEPLELAKSAVLSENAELPSPPIKYFKTRQKKANMLSRFKNFLPAGR